MLDNTAYTGQYSTIYKGVVVSNEDPKGMGRCKIKIPAAHGESSSTEILPWSRPLVLSPVGKNRKSAMIPDVGESVWVVFEGGKKEYPIYFGGSYTPNSGVSSGEIIFYLEGGNSIKYERSSNTYSVTIGDVLMKLSSEGVSIKGDTKIEGDLYVKGNTTLEGDTEVIGNLTVTGTISARDLSVSGTASISNLIPGSCSKECTCQK